MSPRVAHRHRHGCRGFSLLEVLVTLLLVSFGLLGTVALQARATQYSAGAEDTGRAALLASEIATQMWTAGGVTLPAGTVTAWAARVADPTAGGLPGGTGTVVVNGTVATVTLQWRAPHEPASTRHRYVTQVVVPAVAVVAAP